MRRVIRSAELFSLPHSLTNTSRRVIAVTVTNAEVRKRVSDALAGTDDNTLQLLHHIQRDKVRLVGALELQRGVSSPRMCTVAHGSPTESTLPSDSTLRLQAKRWAERVRQRIAARNAIAAAEAEARAALAAQAIEEERIRREHEVLGSDARHTLLPMYIILCAASALHAHGEQAPAGDGHVTVGNLRDVRNTIEFNEEESGTCKP